MKNMESYSLCEEFKEHPWRKLCSECKKPKEDHNFNDEDTQKIQTTLLSLEKDSKITEPKSDSVYAWIPRECPQDRLEEFFKCFPEDKIPKYQSQGLQNRFKQIIKQIPLTDISQSNCRFVDKECAEELLSHIQDILNKVLRFGSVKVWNKGMPLQCPTCFKLLEDNELVVLSAAQGATAYHPICFVCSVCKEQLVDLIHCSEVDGSNYCIRHYSETRKKRCQACDELIFSLRFAQANDVYYHKDHLCCFACDKLLENGTGFEKDDELYCTGCYETLFSSDCEKCKKKISLDSPHVPFEDKFWHHECFTCEKCGEVLTSFEKHEDKLFCVKCYQENYAPKCVECKKVFEGHTKVVKYEENVYHVNCFKCADCKDTIGTGTFVPHGDLFYCKGCHLRNFGVRCYKCHYAITDDHGVMYNKQPYHAACFTCSECSVQLAKQSFKLIGESLYCLNCFGDKYCKNCHSCEKPIVLGEKDVLFSYGDYSWHSACFVCQSCSSSLANRPFFIRGSNLVCKECTSQENTVSAEVKHTNVEGEESSVTRTRTLNDKESTQTVEEQNTKSEIENTKQSI